MLHVDPKMLDLYTRRERAGAEGWLGELEGLDLTLTHLLAKRDEAKRIGQLPIVTLGPTRRA